MCRLLVFLSDRPDNQRFIRVLEEAMNIDSAQNSPHFKIDHLIGAEDIKRKAGDQKSPITIPFKIFHMLKSCVNSITHRKLAHFYVCFMTASDKKRQLFVETLLLAVEDTNVLPIVVQLLIDGSFECWRVSLIVNDRTIVH